MQNDTETVYQYTPRQVADLLGVTPATIRSHAHRHAVNGHTLGQLQPKAGGGFVRLYSDADVAYLRDNKQKRGPKPHGR